MPQSYTVLHKWQPSTIWWMMALAKCRYLPSVCGFVYIIKPIYATLCGNITSGKYKLGKM